MLTQEIMELAGRMCGEGADREVLLSLCQAARQEVESQLKPGTSPQDCGPAFLVAAAWLALAGLETSQGEEGVSSFTAGELTIRKEGATSAQSLRKQAWELMAPYRRDTFCFQGVRG